MKQKDRQDPRKKSIPQWSASSLGDLPTTGAGTNTRLPAPAGLTEY